MDGSYLSVTSSLISASSELLVCITVWEELIPSPPLVPPQLLHCYYY